MQGGWIAYTSYKDDIERQLHLTHREEEKEFSVGHAQEHAATAVHAQPVVGVQVKETTIDKRHCLMIVYRDSRNNKLTVAKVTLSPEEDFEKIVNKTSLLQKLSVKTDSSAAKKLRSGDYAVLAIAEQSIFGGAKFEAASNTNTSSGFERCAVQ